MKDDLNVLRCFHRVSNLCAIIALCEKNTVTDKKTFNKYIDLHFIRLIDTGVRF